MMNRRGKKKERVTDFIFLGSRITAMVTATMKLKDACSVGKKWKQGQTLFSWAPTSLQTVTAAMKLKDAYSLEEKL